MDDLGTLVQNKPPHPRLELLMEDLGNLVQNTPHPKAGTEHLGLRNFDPE